MKSKLLKFEFPLDDIETFILDEQLDKIKQHKKRVNCTINKHTIDRLKIVADKDTGKMSNIFENLIRRYVESRV